jgi:hypothetical protein
VTIYFIVEPTCVTVPTERIFTRLMRPGSIMPQKVNYATYRYLVLNGGKLKEISDILKGTFCGHLSEV